MKQNRIFIENLPETVTEPEIRSKFSEFGDVTSLEIKERKIVTAKHSSNFFAYVNLTTNENNLQKCFHSFADTPWCGQYVKLQIAKESFLERLKRERESNLSKNEPSESVITSKDKIAAETSDVKKVNENQHIKQNKAKSSSSKSSEEAIVPASKKPVEKQKLKRKKAVSSSSDSSDEEDEIPAKITKSHVKEEEPVNEFLQLKKATGGAKFVNGRLKIGDFGKGPIFPNKSEDKKLDDRQAEAEARRKKAVQEKIRAYHQQKKAFSTFVTQRKIIKFTDDDNETNEKGGYNKKTKSKSQKVHLFQSDSEEDDIDIGKNIERRIKSDDRFALDHRFEGEEDEVPDRKSESNQKVNKYIRYDPTNPEHKKYEKQELEKRETKKKEKKVEEKPTPEVSQETIYEINADLKTILGNSGGFSLTEMFGSNSNKKEEKCEDEETTITPFQSENVKNPFRYESSDDEEEIEKLQEEKRPQPATKPKKLWTEPLFFQENDFRFQEGLDFVKRIATQKRADGQFERERREFMQVVRKKIRNVQKKNKQFKKKLGGSKKKKMKRVEKALKR